MSGAIILLVITVITAEGRPDIVRRMDEPSIEKCWQDAAAFFAQGIPKKYEGMADGLAAQCRANTEALKADEHS